MTTRPDESSQALSALAPAIAQTFVSLASDIALVIDAHGIIRSVALNADAPAPPDANSWVGQRWVDTVTSTTRPKIEKLLQEVSATGVSRRREVNHPNAAGDDIPMAYTALRLGAEGPVLAAGRDLRAVAAIQQRFMETQQEMERDYWRKRHGDFRYQMLFQVATDGVLVVDANTLTIMDANPAASAMLDLTLPELAGTTLPCAFEAKSEAAVTELLAAARRTGRPAEVRVRAAKRDLRLCLNATPFRGDNRLMLLVRARRHDGVGAAANDVTEGTGVFEQLPEGIVVTDPNGRIMLANPAFLDLAGIADEERARGQLLSQWVGSRPSELAAVLATARLQGLAARRRTVLRSAHGTEHVLEMSAALVPEFDQECIGFTLRRVFSARDGAPADARTHLLASIERVAKSIGEASLPDLIRESSEHVERYLIEQAMHRAGGDTRAAARLLDIALESLELRLHRHLLGGDTGSEQDSPG